MEIGRIRRFSTPLKATGAHKVHGRTVAQSIDVSGRMLISADMNAIADGDAFSHVSLQALMQMHTYEN